MERPRNAERPVPESTKEMRGRLEEHIKLSELRQSVQEFVDKLPSKVGMDKEYATEIYSHELDSVYQMIRDHLSKSTESLPDELLHEQDKQAVRAEFEKLFQTIPTIRSSEGERMNSVQLDYKDHVDRLMAIYEQEVYNRLEPTED